MNASHLLIYLKATTTSEILSEALRPFAFVFSSHPSRRTRGQSPVVLFESLRMYVLRWTWAGLMRLGITLSCANACPHWPTSEAALLSEFPWDCVRYMRGMSR